MSTVRGEASGASGALGDWRRPLGNAQVSGTGFGFGLVVAYFFLEYVRPHDYVSAIGAIHPGAILSVLLFLTWVTKAPKDALREPLIRLHIAFVTLMAVSVFYAVNNYWAFVYTKGMAIMLVAGVLPLIAFVDTDQRLQRFVRYWILFNVVAALAGILNGGRGPGSFLGDENDLALTLNVAIPYAFYLSQSPKNSPLARALLIAATVAMILGVIATMSRGGFVGLMAVLLGLMFFSKNRIRNLLLIALIGGAASFYVTDKYVEEMKTIDTDESTAQQRLYYWGRAWEMFLDHPFFGVGAQNFPWRVQEYELRDPDYDIRFNRLSGGRAVHSAYFSLISELGLAGILIFSVILFKMVKKLRAILRRYRSVKPHRLPPDHAEINLITRAASVGLVGYLFSGAFLSVLYEPHLWYLVGLIIVLDRLSQRYNNESQHVETGVQGGRRHSDYHHPS